MKKIVLGILVVIILIQFIRPEKNSAEVLESFDPELVVTDAVASILTQSCLDCHSNNTIYPWYAEIAPVSWYVAWHVNDAKNHMNLSEWANYNADQKRHVLKDIKEVLDSQEMPLSSYLLIHRDAIVSESDYKTLLIWAESIKLEP